MGAAAGALGVAGGGRDTEVVAAAGGWDRGVGVEAATTRIAAKILRLKLDWLEAVVVAGVCLLGSLRAASIFFGPEEMKKVKFIMLRKID